MIDEPRFGFYVLAAGGHGIMWGSALGMKMAELVTEERLSDLDPEEVRLRRFTEGRMATDAIHLPFPH
jgi:sarcosine oxidase subunit beta